MRSSVMKPTSSWPPQPLPSPIARGEQSAPVQTLGTPPGRMAETPQPPCADTDCLASSGSAMAPLKSSHDRLLGCQFLLDVHPQHLRCRHLVPSAPCNELLELRFLNRKCEANRLRCAV